MAESMENLHEVIFRAMCSHDQRAPCAVQLEIGKLGYKVEFLD